MSHYNMLNCSNNKCLQADFLNSRARDIVCNDMPTVLDV